MRTRFLLPFTLAAASLSAQPAITLADAPQDGQQYTYVRGNHSTVTETGEDAFWDFSGAGVLGDALQLTYLDPVAAGSSTLHPTATIAMEEAGNTHYLRTDATGQYRVGMHMDISGFAVHVQYSDEELLLPYPCTFGTAWADTNAYSYTVQGTVVDGGGHNAFTAVGFGSLQLPYGTMDNVLMLSGASVTEEAVPGTSFRTEMTSVFFYRPGLSTFLLRADEVVMFQNGVQTQSGSSLLYLSEDAFLGLAEPLGQQIGLEAWPVPARDRLHVRYALPGGRQVELHLHDAAGRLVMHAEQRTQATGIQQAELGTEQLPAGTYLLTVSDDQGQRGSRKLVVE